MNTEKKAGSTAPKKKTKRNVPQGNCYIQDKCPPWVHFHWAEATARGVAANGQRE